MRSWVARSGLVWGLASSACSLTADLDSLTSGGGEREQADAASAPRSESNESSEGEATAGELATEQGQTADPITSGESSPDPTSASSACLDCTGSVDAVTTLPLDPATETADATETVATAESGASPATLSSEVPEATSTTIDVSSPADEDTAPPTTASLLHRYSFDDTGAGLEDSVGGADGTAVGEVTQSGGRLVVSGDGYGELPPEIMAGLTDMTIEVWFTSYQTRSWERVFDFGETENGSGKSYLFFTSQVPSANGTMRVSVRPFGETELTVNTAEDTADDLETHIAVVFDDTNDEIRIYHDGQLSGSVTTNTSLSEINFQHCWLGRSMFTSDPLFEGDFDEVRIYGAAVDADYVARSFAAGPNTVVP